MKPALFLLSILVAALPGLTHAEGNGCYGDSACATQNPQAQQQQQQQGVTVGDNSYHRYVNVRPVQVPNAISMVPAAGVSRLAAQECGPRMRVINRGVSAVNNRTLKAEHVELGYDQYVLPDEQEAYRRVQLTPGLVQLIGHRVVETTAPLTVSTSGGWSISGFNSHGGGGGGISSSGALQRLITTVRLLECVAYEIDTRPLKPRG